VLSAAGIESSKLPPAIDGHSFAPTLLGKAQPQPPFIYHDFGGPQDPGAGTKRFSKDATVSHENQPFAMTGSGRIRHKETLGKANE